MVDVTQDFPYLEGQIPESFIKHGMICRPLRKVHPVGVFYGKNPLNYSFTLILLEVLFIIFLTWMVRFLLRPLKQPRVVSEILGGLIVGPSILGRNKNFAEKFMPENRQFVVRNLGIMGFMFFLFIAGVKMDMTYIRRAGRKHIYLAIYGVIIPSAFTTVVALATRDQMDESLAKVSTLGGVISAFAITSFPVLSPILKELNLLSSEVGRLAMSTAIIGDIIGLIAIVSFEAVKQGEVHPMNGVWYLVSLICLAIFLYTAIRWLMQWIVSRTPDGKPVGQGYVVGILVLVGAMGFLTDFFGMAIANGPLWLGLVIPDGPPLGATLVERTETFVAYFLMPFSFAVVGMYTDVSMLTAVGWAGVGPLFAMVATAYITKVIGSLVPAMFYNIPFKDSLTFSLILSLRGQVELLLFLHWIDKMMISLPGFTLLVISMTSFTMLITPIISILYDPTKPYTVIKRRTIQHHTPNTELRMIVCIHEQETVAGLLNLLEASHPTATSPFSVSAIHVIELIGRAMPVCIDYEEEAAKCNATPNDNVHSALKQYETTRGGREINFHSLTVMAPLHTIYQNICELAIERKSTLVILPYHSVYSSEYNRVRVHRVNVDVLTNAPCSVGLLVDKGEFRNPLAGCTLRHSVHQFVVLFLGGADGREALAYADRMATNPDVAVVVIRFLTHNSEGWDEMDKKLDDGVVTWFWVKNESNDRVAYREVVVRNGAETVSAIQALNDDAYYDLWIVGRQQLNPVLLEGFADWTEENELGILGEYITSTDFGSSASVLVIQQQVLRNASISFLPIWKLPWEGKFLEEM